MADADAQAFKSQKQVPEISSDQPNTSKLFNNFLFKAAIVAVCLVLLPFFPSQAPEFVNQTRSWELLQLIFVGLAVSYGLFSKKNDETDKEISALKLDNAQSYVSKLLQVSSVFDDESENVTVVDGNKVQTWSSQYYRGPPVVVVAEESSGVKAEECAGSGIRQKPLLLPVRSLKQRVFDANEVDLVNSEKGCFNMSDSSSKRFGDNSRRSRNGEFGELECKTGEDVDVKGSNVLGSPIPWRSRSGRMEVKENEECSSTFPTYLDDDSVLNRSNSSRKLASSMSFSSESRGKSGEEMVRKSNISAPPPVPPPPPPPPPSLRKSVVVKPSSSVMDEQVISSEKIMRRSPLSVVPAGESDEVGRANSSVDLRGKSVRTFRPLEPYSSTRMNDAKSPKGDGERFNERVLEELSCEESDAESEEEDDYSQGREEAAINDAVSDSAPDVDRKADEFIARFREQIRLQRIDSIRRSTTQRTGKALA